VKKFHVAADYKPAIAPSSAALARLCQLFHAFKPETDVRDFNLQRCPHFVSSGYLCIPPFLLPFSKISFSNAQRRQQARYQHFNTNATHLQLYLTRDIALSSGKQTHPVIQGTVTTPVAVPAFWKGSYPSVTDLCCRPDTRHT
jgi:hypothetical protein